MPDTRSLWLLSFFTSITLLVLLFVTWAKAMQYDPIGTQLTTKKAIDKHLQKYAKGEALTKHTKDHQAPEDPDDTKDPRYDDLVRIPTGFYIQTLDFYDSTRVYLTGYLWQHFPENLPEEFSDWKEGCSGEQLPFIFPDRVNSGSDIEPVLRYHKRSPYPDYGYLCGWYFEVTLRQKFDYKRYPFDHETVWLRLWIPKMLNSLNNVVLIPDLDAYPGGTSEAHEFGIDERIVLNSWERENTFFSYTTVDFNTTFGGILNPARTNSWLELNYNFVIKRKLGTSMVEHLLGITVVMILLFSTLLVVSRDPEKANRHGFDTAMVLGACSALFFVILIAHISLRQQFEGNAVVYIEMYYYLVYGLLMGIAINTYPFLEQSNRLTAILHFRDNLIPKLLYWPVILAYAVAVSWYWL